LFTDQELHRPSARQVGGGLSPAGFRYPAVFPSGSSFDAGAETPASPVPTPLSVCLRRRMLLTPLSFICQGDALLPPSIVAVLVAG